MSSNTPRAHNGAVLLDPVADPADGGTAAAAPSPSSAGLSRHLSAIKGQAHFLLYLADQLEDALAQVDESADPAHRAFLSKVFAMYSGQLETKHHGLGDRISEVCQELYLMVRELESA